MYKLFFILTAIIFAYSATFACKLTGKSIEKFDETEYIFIGEVVGYTKSFESKDLNQPAHGLIVKLKESIFLPQTPKNYFEVFPIELWSDCSLSGKRLKDLSNDFSIGSEIRVIAKESVYLSDKKIEGSIRLEERPNEIGSIALNFDEKKQRMTSAKSVFDFKNFLYDFNKDSNSKYLLPDFEIRKDLLRLKNSRTQAERDAILKRFLDVPGCCNNLDFHGVFKTYSANDKDFNTLYEIHLKSVLPDETFKQYKIISEVTQELKKLGYKDSDIEKALEKAIGQETEITKQILLDRTLEILKEPKN